MSHPVQAPVNWLQEIERVYREQVNQWGDQSNLPDGPVTPLDRAYLATARESKLSQEPVSFRDIFREEAGEVITELEPEKLIIELLQVTGVALQWLDKLGRQNSVSELTA